MTMAEEPAQGPVIARIENRRDRNQVIELHYARALNGFITSGIRVYFGHKEILIPAHLVIRDLHLMGAIVSAILERISQAEESEISFSYARRFKVLEQEYELSEQQEYMRLSRMSDLPA